LRYQTKAVGYYRRKNQALAAGQAWTESDPSYEEGRCLIADGRSLDEINGKEQDIQKE